MATPSQVRAGLALVTTAAVTDTRTVAQVASNPADVRAALFAAVPLIVGDYIDGSASLAVDWYQELRNSAAPPKPFSPSLFTPLDQDALSTSVAVATKPLFDLERDLNALTDEMLRRATEDSLKLLTPEVQKGVAAGFWDTITNNTNDDPSAVGWQRFTRGAACKFCLMLAGRGAVYTESTARFAAHGGCHCVAGPSFDPKAPRASVLQYTASLKNRTSDQRAALREYLNHHFPDAPG